VNLVFRTCLEFDKSVVQGLAFLQGWLLNIIDAANGHAHRRAGGGRSLSSGTLCCAQNPPPLDLGHSSLLHEVFQLDILQVLHLMYPHGSETVCVLAQLQMFKLITELICLRSLKMRRARRWHLLLMLLLRMGGSHVRRHWVKWRSIRDCHLLEVHGRMRLLVVC